MNRHTDTHIVTRLAVVETGRRRRWTAEEKLRIVEESLAGHRQASATARRHGIPTSLLFRWRRDLLGQPVPASMSVPTFAPVTVVPDTPPRVGGDGRIEIVLRNGRRVIVGPGMDGGLLVQVLDVVEGR